MPNDKLTPKQITDFVADLEALDAPFHWGPEDYVCMESSSPDRCMRMVSASCPDKELCEEHLEALGKVLAQDLYEASKAYNRFMEARR